MYLGIAIRLGDVKKANETQDRLRKFHNRSDLGSEAVNL